MFVGLVEKRFGLAALIEASLCPLCPWGLKTEFTENVSVLRVEILFPPLRTQRNTVSNVIRGNLEWVY
jgi:hypothetical protein